VQSQQLDRYMFSTLQKKIKLYFCHSQKTIECINLIMINLFPKLHLKQKLILGADSYIGIGVKKKTMRTRKFNVFSFRQLSDQLFLV